MMFHGLSPLLGNSPGCVCAVEAPDIVSAFGEDRP